MSEPTIKCPNCATEIKLTESLAAPLIESTRRDYEKKMSQKDAEVANREKLLREQGEALDQQRTNLETQIADRLKQEKQKIAAEEAKKAKLAVSSDLEARSKEIAELQQVLNQKNAKLEDAAKAQVELLRKQRELDDAKREMELNIEKRVQESLDNTRQQARKEAEEQLGLKVMEKEQTILSMQKQIEDLRKKAEQGSQQLQGEVLELQLENLLKNKFPDDCIEPVPKGEHGGDILQRVITSTGAMCGTILWESKRTKNWSEGWLTKLRDDQRRAKAEIAIIVSSALPSGIDSFDHVDGVWITHPRTLIPVALSLRHTLIEVNCARQTSEGQKTKTELVYQYLTGPKFKLRVQAIVEAFTTMADDLTREKKVIMKQWAKREEQITHVLEATVGMYGDLQAIAGKSLQEIDGLELKALAGPATEEQSN